MSQGEVRNHTLGCTFGPGDYCYQADEDGHGEEFIGEVMVYVSYRGRGDSLVEFFDDEGKTSAVFCVSDFVAGLKSC